MSADNVVSRELEGLLRRLSPADRPVPRSCALTPPGRAAIAEVLAALAP